MYIIEPVDVYNGAHGIQWALAPRYIEIKYDTGVSQRPETFVLLSAQCFVNTCAHGS